MRGDLSGMSQMDLALGRAGPGAGPCPPGQCIADPHIETVSALPAGTSAPNTLITESAVATYHLPTATVGWWIQTPTALTSVQVGQARQQAAAAGLLVETNSDSPSSTEVLGWATVAGVLLALAILTMSIGPIRSETASDLRTLTAAGANSRTRRTITAATAATLGVLGGVVGLAAAYIACIAFLRASPNGDGISELANVPVANVVVLLVGLPLTAAVGGYVFGGRQPSAVARRPLDQSPALGRPGAGRGGRVTDRRRDVGTP